MFNMFMVASWACEVTVIGNPEVLLQCSFMWGLQRPQALTLRIFHTCSLPIFMLFNACPGTSHFVLYLSLYNFYLSRTIGQSLMSNPGPHKSNLQPHTWYTSCRFYSTWHFMKTLSYPWDDSECTSPLRLLGSGSSPVSWCDDHERDKSVWSCTSRRRV